MPNDLVKWLLPIAVSAFFGVVGGGYSWAYIKRVRGLIRVADLKDAFVTKPEFDAHSRRDDERYQRIIEDYAEPSRDLARAILQLTGAIADLKVSSGLMKGQIDRINEQLGELVEHSMQRRASDPPARGGD
jgi:hypothetical protein